MSDRISDFAYRYSATYFMRATSQSPCLHETLTTAAIIKIDPLGQLLICNATSKIREAYFISFFLDLIIIIVLIIIRKYVAVTL